MSSKYRQKVVGNGETTPKKYGARIEMNNEMDKKLMIFIYDIAENVYKFQFVISTTLRWDKQQQQGSMVLVSVAKVSSHT
ncbi:hypothetical protein L3Y34_006612 [Caenorhabditis briggsae]|uniref:Uncharacterized protein n=1 Tax=Caenorhabditis briggsae TaxID=6238 RepID=A0AAE8ZX88_CAEBR|nr:hypothetical protein L3Y34_006612 [Caenorhabditis briggsae]